MSLISIGMNLLLVGLLLAAMVVGLRLNKRLKALKDSHEGFEAAVHDLNRAAARAEQGLADLRAATDEATDLLSDRIEKGRALAIKLERLTAAAPAIANTAAAARAARPQPQPAPRLQPAVFEDEDEEPAIPPGLARILADADPATERRLGALISAARAARARPETLVPAEPAPAPSREPLVGRAPLPGRRITSMVDDDLFEDAPLSFGARR